MLDCVELEMRMAELMAQQEAVASALMCRQLNVYVSRCKKSSTNCLRPLKLCSRTYRVRSLP